VVLLIAPLGSTGAGCRGVTSRLILAPARQPLAGTAEVERVPIASGPLANRDLVLFTETFAGDPARAPDVHLLAFTGNTGGAERMTRYVARLVEPWFAERPGMGVAVTSVQYPGYGDDRGRSSLSLNNEAARRAYAHVAARDPGQPIVVFGVSLGTIPALEVARAFGPPPAGPHALILEKPPNLRAMILGRHGWWNLWVAAGAIAAGVPREAVSDRLAAQITETPVLFILASGDSVVPAAYSKQVIAAYRGPGFVATVDGDHRTPPFLATTPALEAGLAWLVHRLP
jgi:fermentation-respiration switch protein FrsA (DUF1100 family)